MVTSPFVPSPGYTYLQPSQAQIREYHSLKGKPEAQKAFLEGMGKFLGWEAARAKQVEAWKQDIRAQYPASRYEVSFTGEQAQVRQLTTTEIMATLPTAQQQVMAKGIENVLAFQAKHDLEKGYRRLSPSARGVFTRSLAMLGVGLAVGRRGKGAELVTLEPSVSTQSVPSPKFGGYTITPYSEDPRVKSAMERYEKGERYIRVVEPSFTEYHEATRVKSASELEGSDVPFYEAVRRAVFEQPGFSGEIIKHTPFVQLFGNVGVGIIKDVESTVGFVEALAGRPSQRSYIQTLGGTAIGEAVALATGQPVGVQAERYAASLSSAPGEEMVGELVGMYLTGRVIGAIAGRAYSWLSGTRAGQAVKFSRPVKSLTQATAKVKEILPSFRGSRVDLWLAQHSKYYYKKTGGIAVGEVVIPPVPQRLGFASLQATQRASTLLVAPRTSGVWIGKTFLEPMQKGAVKHLISRGGQLSIGYLREMSFRKSAVETVAAQRSVLPIVTQTHVTRMGILPYIGGQNLFTLSRSVPSLIPFVGLKFLPSLRPSEAHIPLMAYHTRIMSLTETKQKQRQLQALALPTLSQAKLTQSPTVRIKQPALERDIPFITPIITPTQRQKIAPILKSSIIHYVPPILKPPALQTPTVLPPMHLPRGGLELPRGKGLGFGKWHKRTHSIKAPGDLLGDFLGRKRKK